MESLNTKANLHHSLICRDQYIYIYTIVCHFEESL